MGTVGIARSHFMPEVRRRVISAAIPGLSLRPMVLQFKRAYLLL